jgi:hypothetical protein
MRSHIARDIQERRIKCGVKWNVRDRTEIRAGFWRGNPKEERHLEDLYINHRTQDRQACILGSKKIAGIFVIAEKILASQGRY